MGSPSQHRSANKDSTSSDVTILNTLYPTHQSALGSRKGSFTSLRVFTTNRPAVMSQFRCYGSLCDTLYLPGCGTGTVRSIHESSAQNSAKQAGRAQTAPATQRRVELWTSESYHSTLAAVYERDRTAEAPSKAKEKEKTFETRRTLQPWGLTTQLEPLKGRCCIKLQHPNSR